MLSITASSKHTATKSASFSPHLYSTVFHITYRRILAYLIPLRILKGHLPSAELMGRFPVLDEIFSPFVTAIRKGDLEAYDEALEKWESRLLELNLWLSLEKARELCLRGLFRRMCVLSTIINSSL